MHISKSPAGCPRTCHQQHIRQQVAPHENLTEPPHSVCNVLGYEGMVHSNGGLRDRIEKGMIFDA